jgi:hypothetical protein
MRVAYDEKIQSHVNFYARRYPYTRAPLRGIWRTNLCARTNLEQIWGTNLLSVTLVNDQESRITIHEHEPRFSSTNTVRSVHGLSSILSADCNCT